VNADDEDIALVHAHEAAIAHCPVSNAKLGHGIAPLHRYLEAGVRVGLGSDSVASNNRMDLLDEARTAVLMQSAARRTVDSLSAGAAFALATLGGARALGIDADTGSLDVGKCADLAAFSLGGGPGHPVQDPVTALVHSLGGAHAVFVAVDGQVRVRDGIVVGADAGLEARVCEAGERLRAWLDEVARSGGPVPPASATR
jgi:5-methylthioadenosine/S-adenosylhomocysteine deaminase